MMIVGTGQRENSLTDINTDVIRRARQGDKDVIASLYEHHHVRVFQYLYYRVNNEQVAEDLTSEVFERMLRFISSYQPSRGAFQAWLYRIARNLVIDYYRSEKVRQTQPLPDNLVDEQPGPAAQVDLRLDSERLRRGLGYLTGDQCDVILMRFVAGMRISETAIALQKTENAVKGLQKRALITLKQYLSGTETGDVRRK